MKFTAKMSGTMITEFNIQPLFNEKFIWLSDIMQKITRQEAMNFILEELRFYKGYAEKSGDWVTTMDRDTIYKVTVLNNYPEYGKEFIEYFGENWMQHYIRFNH